MTPVGDTPPTHPRPPGRRPRTRKAGRPSPRSARQRRRAARFLAVQALYQAEMSGASLASVIQEYFEHRLQPGLADSSSDSLGPADQDTFSNAVLSAGRHREQIANAIRRCLKDGWTVDRLDPVLRASLRAAGGELAAGTAAAAEILGDYTDLARAFGGSAKEIGFANALLEAIAADLAEISLERRE